MSMMVTRCKFVHNLKCEEVSRHINELHELVRDMWHELHAEEGSAQRRMALAGRMRELGIEVDE